jgi:hypothetical protein
MHDAFMHAIDRPEHPFVEPRKRLVEWVRDQLVGAPPAATDDPDGPALRAVLPTERFPCGAIYPVSSSGDGIDPAGDEVEEAQSVSGAAGDDGEEPAIVRRYTPPSSLGFSFFIKGARIELQLLCSAVRYERTKRDERGRYVNEWTRRALVPNGDTEEVVNVVCSSDGQRQKHMVLNGRARLDVFSRRFADGWIVTVALCNTQSVADETKEFALERAEKTLFEASLRCVIDSGEVGEYPRVDRSLLDEEEQEIELQYAEQKIHAVGHGCAADWATTNGKVTELCTQTMPVVEVPQMTADTGSDGDTVLSLAELSRFADGSDLLSSELSAFVDGYAAWAAGQRDDISRLSNDDRAAAERICHRIETTVKRMRGGLALLGKDEQVRLAFALANQAMLDQMRQYDLVRGKPRGDGAYRWRPFQLAFLLTLLESTADPDSEDRDTVDLIWFPTGGGKTEAYLGLIAFQIGLRRLRHAHTGGGTCVLMRYTLRLLTRDQYLRASRLICAMERLRRERNDLGTEPISIGLWVGKATSPNTFAEAEALVTEARASGEQPALVLDSCPWCGHAFDPHTSYPASARQFGFHCCNPQCELRGALPCNVVDEALYAKPPTMLVATVDKFARLAWEERATAFFGGAQCRPPELIIQDELHLISSALGSVAGLYEAGLDTVLRLRGVYPKYVASTATIRMATQQVRRLYGRAVSVFPPPGLSREDSYFARTVPLRLRPGRIYVGYLAPMLNRQKCLAPLAAALLLAPFALFQDEQEKDALLDAWWTQVVYHGSLKGVGNSHTAFVSDVGEFMRLLGPESSARTQTNIAQLTSLQTAKENSAIFSQLALGKDAGDCLDAVLATNMVSVGLDVARLALMTINGQPLTSAEYIQASSRVGRSEVPGVVFMNYYRDQARSLSHYESFRPYHEAFYRFVEPTSVTPYTYQARQRALHAALVIVMRHARIGLAGNEDAANFDPDHAVVGKAIEELKQRCGQSASDQSQRAEIEAHVDSLVAAWRSEVERCRISRRALRYQVPGNDNAADRLLYNHDDRIKGVWPTLQSLRNVENSALLKVL